MIANNEPEKRAEERDCDLCGDSFLKELKKATKIIS
jgi:hypothetical protein